MILVCKFDNKNLLILGVILKNLLIFHESLTHLRNLKKSPPERSTWFVVVLNLLLI